MKTQARSTPPPRRLTTSTQPETGNTTKRRWRLNLDGPAVIGAVTLILFILACVFVPEFATTNNLRALVLSVSLVGIVAVGLSIITIVGRMFSLSLSAVVASAAILFAATLHLGPWAALGIAVAFGILTGLVQGLLIGAARTDPIVTTIAAAAIILGVAQLITGGQNVIGEGDASVFGTLLLGAVPFQVVVFLVVAMVAALLHRYTAMGREITLIGLNEKAAAVAGLRAWPRVLAAFIISGALAALAGALLASESGQGNLMLGASYGFDAIIAVVIGGIGVKGGRGNPISAAVGALLVGLLANALVLLGLSYEDQLIFQGLLVLAAVVITGATANASTPRKR